MYVRIFVVFLHQINNNIEKPDVLAKKCPSHDSTNNNGTSGLPTIYNRYKIEHCIDATFNTENFVSSNF